MDVGDFVGDSDEDVEVEETIAVVTTTTTAPIGCSDNHAIQGSAGVVAQSPRVEKLKEATAGQPASTRPDTMPETLSSHRRPVDDHVDPSDKISGAPPAPSAADGQHVADDEESTAMVVDHDAHQPVSPPVTPTAATIPAPVEDVSAPTYAPHPAYQEAEVEVEKTNNNNKKEAKAEEDEEVENGVPGPRAKFQVGDIVHVAARTWPGINKQGGAGKIASIVTEPSESGSGVMEFLYNVKYMLGGFEKRIEEEFLQDLGSTLETGARPHKERVFYHEEFAIDPNKKHKPVHVNEGFMEDPSLHSTPVAHPQRGAVAKAARLPVKQPVKKPKRPRRDQPVLVDAPDIPYELRSSGDSDYDVEEEEEDDEGDGGEEEEKQQNHSGPSRRLDDGSFIMGERLTTVTERRRLPPSQQEGPEARRRQREKKKHQAAASHPRDATDPLKNREKSAETNKRAHKKRSHRIIESDDDDDQEEEDEEEDDDDVTDGHGTDRRKKKRRYIGGYEEDAESGFIEPEGNTAALPEDVARELQFKVGKTKAELRLQLHTTADELVETLREIRERKDALDAKLQYMSSLDEGEMRQVFQELVELSEFIRTRYIHSGEDKMNTIIKKLERKGAVLPEQIDIRYEKWLAEGRGYCLWVNQNLDALESSCLRRGIQLEVEDHDQSYSPDPASSGSDLDSPRHSMSVAEDSDQDDFESHGDATHLPDLGSGRSAAAAATGTEAGWTAPPRKRLEKSHRDGGLSSRAGSRQVSRKRPRDSPLSMMKSQSSMDDFAVPFDERQRNHQFQNKTTPSRAPSMLSNFRFARPSDSKILTDPRWDWARKMKKTKNMNSSSRGGSSAPGGGRRLGIVHSTTTQQKTPRNSGAPLSVMEKVLKLRDKRFRDRWTAAAAEPTAVHWNRVARSTMAPPPSSDAVVMYRDEELPISRPHHHQTSQLYKPSNRLPVSNSFFKRQERQELGFDGNEIDESPASPTRSWSTIFGVLRDHENIPFQPNQVGKSAKELMKLGAVFFHQVGGATEKGSVDGQLWVEEDEPTTTTTTTWDLAQQTTRLATRLRQQLTHLRYEELFTLEAILTDKWQPGMTPPYQQTRAWTALTALSDAYHTDLAAFVDHVDKSIQCAHPQEVVPLLTVAIGELAAMLHQMPDLHTIFVDSPAYPYFFMVASSSPPSDGASSTTPLISSICRLYWYAIQALVRMKKMCESRWLGAKKNKWSGLFSVALPPNRVALACFLFLVDLYLHVPSTHLVLPTRQDQQEEISSEGEEPPPSLFLTSDAPALSLWLLLHELFSGGGLQSTNAEKGSDASFWNFLQTTYRQGFVDHVAVCAIKRISCGGYMKERSPPAINDSNCSDEEMQGKVLAADVLWDLTGVFSGLFTSTLTSSWSLVKELIQCKNSKSMPFDNLSESDIASDSFRRQQHRFKVRVLRRVLMLSARLPPENDMLEKVLVHVWDDGDGGGEGHDHSGVSTVMSFVDEFRQFQDVSSCDETALVEFVSDHATRTTSLLALFCKITVIQLSKMDKPIHRSRYRQPIIRAISQRLELHKSLRASTVPAAIESVASSNGKATATANTKPSWNWGKTNGAAATPSISVQPPQPQQQQQQSIGPPSPQIVSEVKQMLSILLLFGLSSVYLDQQEANTMTPALVARRQKDIQREIDFFCKEFATISVGIPQATMELCQCLHALGAIAIDRHTSYATAFEQLNGLLSVTTQDLQQLRRVAQEKETSSQQQKKTPPSSQVLHLSAGVSACLQVLRDLSAQLTNRLRVTKDVDATTEIGLIQKCASFALSDALASVLDGVFVEGGVSLDDLDAAIEILTLWLPRGQDNPVKSAVFRQAATIDGDDAPRDEFDEFEDQEMMDLLATVELENGGNGGAGGAAASQGVSTTTDHEAVILEVGTYAREAALKTLRVAVQRLLIALPAKRWRSFQELYLLDLLGLMISSCSFPFNWSVVSLASLKPRMLAPRLLASILKYRPEKEWFSTVFLSEQHADAELSTLWLTATLDLRSLMPTVCSSFSTSPAKYASYWLMLTDGIHFNLLTENHVVRYKMDPLVYQLLHDSVSKSWFRDAIQRHADPAEIGTLYGMHLDVFQTFCRSAGRIWQAISCPPQRQEMNRFRVKMMDTQRGVFVALPEAYEINLRSVCYELDRKPNLHWYSLSSRFLDEFTTMPITTSSSSFHAVDDARSVLDKELTDPAMRPLVVLFKFMYDCVDAFLFHCGGMAIGQQNIFYAIIELMFRQAKCAEFPVAARRLQQSKEPNAATATVTTATSAATSPLANISPACAGFTESVRLFFAYQKYPSLLNWFAQNLETYQTLKAGWPSSPLRVLLYNVFDPHGPLGIHSYYPMQDDGATSFDPSAVRREAFYLSCGLLRCKCTKSYEHTQQPEQNGQSGRLAQLRKFILSSFVDELQQCVSVDGDDLDETLLPVVQFVKALLHHFNLNQNRDQVTETLVVNDLVPCLVMIGQHIIYKLQCDRTINETMSCVMLIEFCRILEEVIELTSSLPHGTTSSGGTLLTQFLDASLPCVGFVYHALGQYSSIPLQGLFTAQGSPTHLDADGLRKALGLLIKETARPTVKVNDAIKHEPVAAAASTTAAASRSARNTEDYGISKVRVRADLVSSIRRLTKKCTEKGACPRFVRFPGSGDPGIFASSSSSSSAVAHASVGGGTM